MRCMQQSCRVRTPQRGNRRLLSNPLNRRHNQHMAVHDTDNLNRPTRIKGRGAASNREGRFETLVKTVEDDGWYREEDRCAATADSGFR